jgi:predicted nucleic-acid-binding protein
LKSGLVVDTHVAIWYLADDPALSARAATALDAATIAGQPIYVPGICIVESIYLAEKSRIPEAAFQKLLHALEDSNPGSLSLRSTGT